MKITIPSHLSDAELDVAVKSLAGKERGTTGELVAHLAELDSRPGVYAGQGYGSLFSYCTQALRLSEDAACNRIEAARACRRFPVILSSLATGEVNLTAVRLLGRHLTAENHEAVLARAKGRSRQQIDVLLAELAPRPDVPSLVRRLPTLAAPPPATCRMPCRAKCRHRLFSDSVCTGTAAGHPADGPTALPRAVHDRRGNP